MLAGTSLYAAATPHNREHPVYRSIPAVSSAALVVAMVASPMASASAQQSNVSVSPFVTILPTTGSNPLAGLALTLAGDGAFGLRASGQMALENQNNGSLSAGSRRPWAVDADAVLTIDGRLLGGVGRAFAPFVFAGIGAASNDSLGYRVRSNNWSYGAGASMPLFRAIDIFGEARWRMSRYVLPTSAMAPTPSQEFRLGVSFHVNTAGRYGSHNMMSRRAELSSSVSIPRVARSSRAAAASLVNTAEDYIGAPYRQGGTSPSGFDGSGFVQYVFARHGVSLPRTSRQQAQVGTAVTPDWRAVSAGDLVLFADNGPISHVAIYAGANRIIHSTSSGGGVRFDDLSTTRGAWFVDHMVAARRVTPDASGLLLDLSRGFPQAGIPLDAPDRAPRR